MNAKTVMQSLLSRDLDNKKERYLAKIKRIRLEQLFGHNEIQNGVVVTNLNEEDYWKILDSKKDAGRKEKNNI